MTSVSGAAVTEVRGTFDRVVEEAALALADLEELLDPARIPLLLLELGLEVATDLSADPQFTQHVAAAVQLVTSLGTEVETLVEAGEAEDAASVAVQASKLITAVQQLMPALDAIAADFKRIATSTSDAAGVAAFADVFAERLVETVVVRHLQRNYPFLSRVLELLTVVEINSTTLTTGDQQTVVVSRYLHLDRIPTLIQDPLAFFKTAYGWGGADFDGATLFARVSELFEVIGPLAMSEDASADTPAVITFFTITFRPTTDNPPGVEGVVHIDLPPSLDVPIAQLGSSLSLRMQISGQLGVDTALRLLPPANLQVVAPAPVNGSAALMLVAEPTDPATPLTLLALPPGTRLQAGRLETGLLSSFQWNSQQGHATGDTGWVFRLENATLVVDGSQSDSFIASLLPSDPVSVDASVDGGWSAARGFYLGTSAGLQTTLNLHDVIGPFTLETLFLAFGATEAGLTLEASFAGSAQVGPLTASVQGIGVKGTLAFERGNLGPFNLALAFQPPDGIGLSVEAQGVVTGGGFLFHDPTQQLYAGSLLLSLNETITLSAFGLIATQMPDGSPGYSLIIFITAEGFQPIPLGLGFTLQGVGGLVAINRTFDQDALTAGLKNDTLKSLLFPANPVGNAPAIIRSLASVFPARRGSYLLGLLARIGWFTPTLVLLDLALILEFGTRKRLIVLGRISALLPSADDDLVRIILDAVGVVDFDASTASIDAVLVDSRLARKFTLTGAMALRADWSSGANSGFVLAVGGVNPHFTPPATLPALPRVAIALSSGDNPRLTCQAYFAITSNTVQFGAQADLYAAAYGFSIEGDVGYDVLIQIAPLHFIADFNASVQLKHGSSNLFKVSVAGELEGPRPLRVSGKASFEILWCDFSVPFDKTLVSGDAPPPPQAIDVSALLKQALARPQSWTAVRPAGHIQGVTLRSLPPGDTLVLEPLGQLTVRQQVVPLDTARDIDLFGDAPVSGERRFHLTATLNGVAQAATPVSDQFAPAQFFAMSDDEKLAAPSFETMGAGLIIRDGTSGSDAAEIVAAPLEYDEIIIDRSQPAQPPGRYPLPLGRLGQLARSGAAARAPVRTIGLARFRNITAPPAATLRAPVWTIQPLGDGPAPALDPSIRTWSEHLAALTTLNRAAAGFQIVPQYELAA